MLGFHLESETDIFNVYLHEKSEIQDIESMSLQKHGRGSMIKAIYDWSLVYWTGSELGSSRKGWPRPEFWKVLAYDILIVLKSCDIWMIALDCCDLWFAASIKIHSTGITNWKIQDLALSLLLVSGRHRKSDFHWADVRRFHIIPGKDFLSWIASF
jgi:hypothetical protein